MRLAPIGMGLGRAPLAPYRGSLFHMRIDAVLYGIGIEQRGDGGADSTQYLSVGPPGYNISVARRRVHLLFLSEWEIDCK